MEVFESKSMFEELSVIEDLAIQIIDQIATSKAALLEEAIKQNAIDHTHQ